MKWRSVPNKLWILWDALTKSAAHKYQWTSIWMTTVHLCCFDFSSFLSFVILALSQLFLSFLLLRLLTLYSSLCLNCPFLCTLTVSFLLPFFLNGGSEESLKTWWGFCRYGDKWYLFCCLLVVTTVKKAEMGLKRIYHLSTYRMGSHL